MVAGRRVRVLSPRHDRGQKVICLMRFALDCDSQINFARRLVRNPATKTGTAIGTGHPRSSIGTRG